MMLSSMLLAAALTAGPVYHDGGYGESIGTYGGFDAYGFGGQLYPYDAPEPWLHGYFQEIPAYGGYAAFRPYNYKHVLSQSQAAGGWGLNPTMPYSQQFWHRYHAAATMSPSAERYDEPAPGYLAPHQGPQYGGPHHGGPHPAIVPPAPISPIGHRQSANDEWVEEQARLRRSFR